MKLRKLKVCDKTPAEHKRTFESQGVHAAALLHGGYQSDVRVAITNNDTFNSTFNP